MREMAAAGLEINVATVVSELSRVGALEGVGGSGYVYAAAEGIPSGKSPLSYMAHPQAEDRLQKDRGNLRASPIEDRGWR